MKKLFVKSLLALSLILILIVSFSACKTDTGETPDGSDASSTPPPELYDIVKDGVSDYVIIRPDGNNGSVREAAIDLQSSIYAKTKVRLNITTDWVSDESQLPQDALEIVVGLTNRPGCGTDNLRINDYSIKFVGRRITIVGGSDAATVLAVRYFINNYLTSPNLSLMSDLNYTHTGEYEYNGLNFNGNDIMTYRIVYPYRATAFEKHAATMLSHYLSESYGVELQMISDNVEKSGNELVVGSTSRYDVSCENEREYLICARGNDIVFSGSVYTIVAAVRDFGATIQQNLESNTTDYTVREDAAPQTPIGESYPAETTLDGKRVIALCDQLNETVVLVDADADNITADSAAFWTWKPTAALGFTSVGNNARRIDDAKIRWSEPLNKYVLVATFSSPGYACIAEYPSGKCIWEQVISGCQPHAIDYLPNGNLLVACACDSTGDSANGEARIYYASQGKNCGYYSIPLESAHGAVWDHDLQLAWFLGSKKLIAVSITGTAKQPKISTITALAGTTPVTGGHDLATDYYDTDYLWITAKSIFVYDKYKNIFITNYDGSDLISASSAKSIGRDEFGNVYRAVATNVYASHDTDVMSLFRYNAATSTYERTDYTFTGRAFYKARVVYIKYN